MRVKIIFRLSFLRTFDLRRTASEQPLPAALAPAVSPAPTATISENRRSDKPFTWVVDYPEGTWECPYALLQSLAAEAMKGFESSPAGGAELGGVLYGTRTGNHVRVTANLPVACEHRNGPAFTLSEPDQAGLDELLGGENEWTKGLKPVGWYHTAYRELIPAPGTEPLLDGWFPERWQAVLVLRRERGAPVQVGFFPPDTNGEVGLNPARQTTVDAVESLPGPKLAKKDVASAEFRCRLGSRFRLRNSHQQNGIIGALDRVSGLPVSSTSRDLLTHRGI
jgi:hypothetical protein